jgi:hypothetical protein
VTRDSSRGLDLAARWTERSYETSWGLKDVLLYAIAVGARPPDELPYVYEKLGPRVLPTFGTRLAGAALQEFGTILMDAQFATVLYSTQLTSHRALPPECSAATTTARFVGHRNAGRHLLVDLEVSTSDTAGPLTTVLHTIWIRGEAVPGEPDSTQKQDSAPEGEQPVIVDQVRPEQYVIWRLQERLSLSDPYPDELHIDPEFTEANGIGRPFITGECTLGFACRAALKLAPGMAHIAQFGARFRGKVYPGDELVTRLLSSANGTFTVAVHNQDGEPVLSDGRIVTKSGSAT